MPTFEYFRKKLEHTGDLLSVVKTMKTLSAVSIRQYEKAVESLEDYNKTVVSGLHILFYRNPRISAQISRQNTGKVGVILYGSELGMCGQFNDEIASFMTENLHKQDISGEQTIVLTLGTRIAGLLEANNHAVERIFSLPGSVKAITGSVRELLVQIEDLRTKQNLELIFLFYNKKTSGASYTPHMIQLWPLNLDWLKELSQKEWESHCLPFYRTDERKLLSGLIKQYLFVSLYRAFAESLASENASRLAAMQAAEKNIQEQMNELQTQYNHLRQSAITAELLDIVSGFEALSE
ncbi:MAG: F0F1 ATP synthase subunit gamma [Calditrichaeota bacterium]|nr:MAG: F0F1 ATP synthase subunit gamma [Calditrichota bacterium]